MLLSNHNPQKHFTQWALEIMTMLPGLGKHSFKIIIPLTMLLLGSAIGGGVGGSLAVRHARLLI
jgi:hypothetical protein